MRATVTFCPKCHAPVARPDRVYHEGDRCPVCAHIMGERGEPAPAPAPQTQVWTLSDAIKAAISRQSAAKPSREMALVKTKLEEALFWAGQAESPEVGT